MHPFVRFGMVGGRQAVLGPGDIIGRSDRAALCLSEPYISEAHAMVSLRSGTLRLLALRGRYSADGKPASQATLREGMRVVLASRLPLVVEEVCLPTEVFALAADDPPSGCTFATQLIPAVASLTIEPTPMLAPGFIPEADATLWSIGPRLFARVGDGPAEELQRGSALVVHGRRFVVTMVALGAHTQPPTHETSEVGAPLHLILSYDTVQIIAGAQRVTLEGISARIVSELAAVRAPLAWQEMARQIWGREQLGESTLRERWDSSLARLRRKLEAARLRTDLVHATRAGLVEILLGPGDTMEDRM